MPPPVPGVVTCSISYPDQLNKYVLLSPLLYAIYLYTFKNRMSYNGNCMFIIIFQTLLPGKKTKQSSVLEKTPAAKLKKGYPKNTTSREKM